MHTGTRKRLPWPNDRENYIQLWIRFKPILRFYNLNHFAWYENHFPLEKQLFSRWWNFEHISKRICRREALTNNSSVVVWRVNQFENWRTFGSRQIKSNKFLRFLSFGRATNSRRCVCVITEDTSNSTQKSMKKKSRLLHSDTQWMCSICQI